MKQIPYEDLKSVALVHQNVEVGTFRVPLYERVFHGCMELVFDNVPLMVTCAALIVVGVLATSAYLFVTNTSEDVVVVSKITKAQHAEIIAYLKGIHPSQIVRYERVQ